MSLGRRLRKARENKGWTQVYVAQVLNITNQALSNYERDFRDPDTNTLNRLAQLYGVSTDVLLGNKNKEPIGQRDIQDLFDRLDNAIENSTHANGAPLDEPTKNNIKDVTRSIIRAITKK